MKAFKSFRAHPVLSLLAMLALVVLIILDRNNFQLIEHYQLLLAISATLALAFTIVAVRVSKDEH